MNSIRLPFFSSALCQQLIDNIEDRISLYKSGIAAIDLGDRGVHTSNTVLSIPPDLTDISPAGDADNAVALYQWLKISPTIAADQRVWTCLCHTIYHDYAVQRQAKKNAKIIRERFFMPGVGFTPRVSNRLSCLWWGAHLTHDPKRRDPFFLTRVLFSLQEIQQSFMERAYGSCLPLLHTTLEVLHERRDDLKASGNQDDHIKRLAKEINTYGGTTLLEAVPTERLKYIVTDRLNALLR